MKAKTKTVRKTNADKSKAVLVFPFGRSILSPKQLAESAGIPFKTAR